MNIFPKTFLGNLILDIYFCPFLKIPKKSWEIISVVTIIEFYRLVTKKNNLKIVTVNFNNCFSVLFRGFFLFQIYETNETKKSQ